MEKSSKVLYKVHQHWLVPGFKILKSVFVFALPISFVILFISNYSIVLFFISLILLSGLIFFYYHFFWSKSYFMIYNDKLAISVRNGFFSKFDMSLHFANIKDTAYAKNNILHFAFDYGTFFARSAAGAQGDFEAPNLPNVERIYKYVNFALSLNEIERQKLTVVNDQIVTNHYKNQKSSQEIIDREIKVLLAIKGIKEVVELSEVDRQFIFEHEEDRNHGVYETLKRDVVLCFTHDDTFRDADAPIVLNRGTKVIFPPVSFHEVEEKNVVSSSPSLEVHNYICKYFKNLDKDDATVLVGFDL